MDHNVCLAVSQPKTLVWNISSAVGLLPFQKIQHQLVTSLTSLNWVWARVRQLVGQLPGLITNDQLVIPFKLLLQLQAKY